VDVKGLYDEKLKNYSNFTNKSKYVPFLKKHIYK